MKIIVLSHFIKTGGPEALHQFVDMVTREHSRHECAIVFFPFQQHDVLLFEHYKVDIKSRLALREADWIIVPESMTEVIAKLPKSAKIAIWWLSLDNYLRYKHDDPTLFGKIKHWIRIRTKKVISPKKIASYTNFCQSQYVACWLIQQKCEPVFLSDYTCNGLSKIDSKEIINRNKEILYNPRKDPVFINMLIKKLPKIKFIPLKDFSKVELEEKYKKAMIYMDFGHFPGKDRMPREAAGKGCILITGRMGASSNFQDFNLLPHFKINQKNKNFTENAEKIITNIMNNPIDYFNSQESYRHEISEEYINFKKEVERALFIMSCV
jgi:hypothetical protein